MEDWRYVYTADGERIFSFNATGGPSRWTLRDLDGRVLREYQNAGGVWSVQRDYVYRGRELLAAHTADPSPQHLTHLHPDHLGTVRAVTNANGSRIAYHAYYPFGEEATAISQNAERMKFTGHERDLANPDSAADDLDYMHARFYSPLAGRFLRVDPGDSAYPGQPQSWNKYAYVLGNPLKYDDPDGEVANAVIGGAIGGILGGAGSIAAQAIRGGEINWRDVGASAAGGVVSGAFAGATLGLSLVAQGGTAGVVAIASVSNAAGGAVTRVLDSSPETQAGDLWEVTIDLSTGAAGGVVGAKAEQAVKAPLSGIRRQISASQPGAKQGNFGAAGSVRGHTAKAQQTRSTAEVAATVAGAKTTNVVVPATRAAAEERKRPPRQ